jgi:hypothetical protein
MSLEGILDVLGLPEHEPKIAKCPFLALLCCHVLRISQPCSKPDKWLEAERARKGAAAEDAEIKELLSVSNGTQPYYRS